MQRTQVKIAILTLMLTASVAVWAAPAAVSGVVRDAQGVTQMGALVQVLGADSVLVGTALTDLHGRYLIANLLPGRYEVRASAALFVPALRGNLQLRSGARAVVNLTLNAMFDTAAWLPAERRKADEPSDDWKWTLRSAANRPILRIFDEDGGLVVMSSSAAEHVHPVDKVRASVTSGDGGFGTGGVHNVFEMDRAMPDGSDVQLRADLGASTGPNLRAPSTSLQAGYERRLGFAGAGRTVMSYQAHPEMVGTGGVSGIEAIQLASAEKTELGDMVDLELGGTIYVVRGSDYAMASRPFLKITAHPTSNWRVGYRMATSRDLQSFEGLDSVELELPVGVMAQGQMQIERGLHQEVSLGRKAGRGTIQISYYADNLSRVALAGGGELTVADLAAASIPGSTANGILADTATDTFRMVAAGYRSQGVNLLMTEPITPGLWVAVEYSTGDGLAAPVGKQPMHLDRVSSELKPRSSQSATVAVKGRVIHSGTQVRASYRWQPEAVVTPVNRFAAFSDQAYLSFFIRQPVHCGNLLPQGLEATVDVTNLLEQGYRPVLSRDGRTLFLAQTPRMVRAGLAFNF
ncbi:carboxypeptidase-like regulatory domain-containing protein [Edaphobacter aggregans]|uniref:carboxypeptidase-like regulatory domain-containing protein n=1 Tax=Edaphobacter aggregans TaxID=570835 RepID=UPI00055603F8|nr:carboxypeptidase-like regulatory domain-containing protein [Edaphobacter aggregans]